MDLLEEAARLEAGQSAGALVWPLSLEARALVDGSGELIGGALDESVLAGARPGIVAAIAAGTTGVIAAGDAELYVEVISPPPELRIFGAGPIAEALCALAARAGFSVIVGDPRPDLIDEARLPDAAAVEVGWPDVLLEGRPLREGSYVVSLLHEARFEDSLLPAALASGARYVGALGSRKTHAARVSRLEERGVSPDDIAGLSAPVGLAIGAVTPEEIAVSILAELVATRRGATS